MHRAAAGNFQEAGGNQLQDFLPKGGLIPTRMSIPDTPTVSIPAGGTERGGLEPSPGKEGLRRGWVLQQTALQVDGASMGPVQGTEQLPALLAHLV